MRSEIQQLQYRHKCTVPGQAFGYNYDGIGNRTKETRGFAENIINYTANNLNQYTQREPKGLVPVVGEADPAATIKVMRNDITGILPKRVVTAERDGKYFKALYYVDNTAGEKTVSYDVFAIKDDPTNASQQLYRKLTGTYTVPRRTQPYTYDADGNLLTMWHNGELWTYTWDGENRLIKAELPTQKVECAYDYQGRRVSKKTYAKAVGATELTLSKTEKYLYDGWNCIAVYNADNALQKSYLWGEDLSGSLQGAGGVGGLLAETNASGTYLPAYNGNGDVMTYLNATDKSIVAEYHYNAFGGTLYATGAMTEAFAYRFSTKPLDEIGYDFIGRIYKVEFGRWLSRDPIGENGGKNVYGFVNNNGINYFDILGQRPLTSEEQNILKQMESLAVTYDKRDPEFSKALRVVINDIRQYVDSVKGKGDPANLRIGLNALRIWIEPGKASQYAVVNETSTCNRYVADVIGDSGFTPKIIHKISTLGMTNRIAGAGEWADSSRTSLGSFGIRWEINVLEPGPNIRSKKTPQKVSITVSDVILSGSLFGREFGFIIAYPRQGEEAAHVGIGLGRGLYISSSHGSMLSGVDGQENVVIDFVNENRTHLYRSAE